MHEYNAHFGFLFIFSLTSWDVTCSRQSHQIALDQNRPRCTAAREGEGRNPPSMTRRKKSCRRRLRPTTSAGGGDGGEGKEEGATAGVVGRPRQPGRVGGGG
jgi:hypothetical protein